MDKYIQVAEIGEGTFGRAIHVKLKTTQQDYVIKTIKSSLVSDRNKREALKEVEVLKQLNHENIVSYIESFEEKNCLHIVMSYCSDGNLAEKIRKRAGNHFIEQEIVSTFRQACQAVGYMHGRNILHRDIKPENIFLTSSGTVKLGDFGLAKVLDTNLQYARTMAGTLCYMSPEILHGKSYKNKSDMWSLGCVLYELVTLRRAFLSIANIISGRFSPISSEYSPELQELITELLSPKPEDRPTAAAVLEKQFLAVHADLDPKTKKATPPISNLDLFLIGGRGNGRSATGNTILGIHGAFKESSHFEMDRLVSEVKWTTRGKHIMKVVDGPCLTNGQTGHIDPSEGFVHCCRGLHALVFVLNFASPRITQEDRHLITLLKTSLGKNIFKDRGIIVFTHGECFDLYTFQREWMTFETWCQQQGGVVGSLIKECANRVVLFYNLTPNKHEESVSKLVSYAQEFGKIFTSDFFTDATKHQAKKSISALSENILARIDLCLNDLKKYLTTLNLTDYRSLKDSAAKLMFEIKNEVLQIPQLASLQSSLGQLTQGVRITNKQLQDIFSELQKIQEPYKSITLTRNSRSACSVM